MPLSKALHDFMFIQSTDPCAYHHFQSVLFGILGPQRWGQQAPPKRLHCITSQRFKSSPHYHQNPKFHNIMCCFTYHKIIWIKVFMLWLLLYTLWAYRTKPDAKIKSANYISVFQFLAQARIIFAAIFSSLTEIIQWQYCQACPWQHMLTTLLPPLPSP